MSDTMTFGMVERTTKFVQTREAILRLALSSIVVALITTQMPFEYPLNRGNPADAYLTGDLNDGQENCGVRAVNPFAKEGM